MKKFLTIAFLACSSMAGNAWGDPLLTPVFNPLQFSDSIDWCQLGGPGCSGATNATPSSWTSAHGQTGQVGMFYSSDSFAVGKDASGMGVINNVSGNNNDDVSVTFDHNLTGVGGWFESAGAGTEYVSLYMFNDVYNIFGLTFIVNFTAPGQSLFLGMTDPVNEIKGAIFDVSDTNTLATQPFLVGQVDFTVPEPGSLALVMAGLLGLATLYRRRA